MQMKKSLKREENYDFLRAVSCISVVILHVAALYSDHDFRYESMPWYYFSFPNFLQIITRAAVPCFVMLSGAFLLDSTQIAFLPLYQKTVRKIGCHLMVFSILSVLWRIVGGDALMTILRDSLCGRPLGHLWYMFMLMGLYAIIPILIQLRLNIGERAYIKLSIFLLFFSCIIHYTCQLFWIVQFLEYLGYFSIGYCIRKYSGSISTGLRTIALVLSFVLFFVVYVLSECDHYLWHSGIKFRDPNFPLVIIGSVLQFIAVAASFDVCLPFYLKIIADRSLIIYMVHPFVYGAIDFVVRHVFGPGFDPLWYVPLLSLVCVVGSTILAGWYLKIYAYCVSVKSSTI